MNRRLVLPVFVALPALAALLLAVAFDHHSSSPFGWLHRSAPPATWARLHGPAALGTLAVPPGFRAVRGDAGTLTATLMGPAGAYLGYLNATPLQGDERLQGWEAFRLEHLRADDARSARVDAAVQAVRTGSVLRSCVVDDYVTRVGSHPFHEVACLVMNGSTGSVVVAATPAGDPAHVFAELEQVVAAYPLA